VAEYDLDCGSMASTVSADLFSIAQSKALKTLAPTMREMLNRPNVSKYKINQTIDGSTIEAQDKIALSQMAQFSREYRIYSDSERFPYQEFANWFLATSLRVNKETFKKYKRFVVEYLETLPWAEASDAMNILINGGALEIDEVSDHGAVSPANGSKNRRQHIIKYFPRADFEIVKNHLLFRSRSTSAEDLVSLLESSLITGLRPVDWRATELVAMQDLDAPRGQRVLLFIANAKATNGRCNGLLRTLDISACSEVAISRIQRSIDLARLLQIEGKFESRFRELFIKLMYRTTCQIWPDDASKGYSLYSCRHQASSNWKSVMSTVEVAALSGHAVPSTTVRWYGHPRHAWLKEHLTEMPQAVPIEMKLINDRLAMHEAYEKSAPMTKPERSHSAMKCR
jgi:hypothetical protein